MIHLPLLIHNLLLKNNFFILFLFSFAVQNLCFALRVHYFFQFQLLSFLQIDQAY